MEGAPVKRYRTAADLRAKITTQKKIQAREFSSAALPGADSLVSSNSMGEQLSRKPRVLLCVGMPHYVGHSRVLQLVTALLQSICMFADVRIICSQGFAAASDESVVFDGVEDATRAAGGSGTTPVFTRSDQQLNPYHAARALAQWADVLIVAPMCGAALAGLANGHDDDLLLEVAQHWASVKKRDSAGVDRWTPRKPFLVFPQLPEERRAHFTVEKQMAELQGMGIELIEQTGDEVSIAQQAKQVSEHVRHAVVKVVQH